MGGASPAYRVERKYQQTPRVCAAQPVVGGQADRSAVTPFRSTCSTGGSSSNPFIDADTGGQGVSGCEEGQAGWPFEPGSAHPRQPPSPHCAHFSWEAGSLPSPWLRAKERTLPALSGPSRPRSLLPWAGHVFICSVTSPTWIEHLLCPLRCEGGGEREPSGSSHSGETD